LRGSESQAAEISLGVYTVAELHRLLENEGWQVIGAYGSLDGRPFELGDRAATGVEAALDPRGPYRIWTPGGVRNRGSGAIPRQRFVSA
jgi:hypothetical protein